MFVQVNLTTFAYQTIKKYDTTINISPNKSVADLYLLRFIRGYLSLNWDKEQLLLSPLCVGSVVQY